jgi:uncharacterized membrane protein
MNTCFLCRFVNHTLVWRPSYQRVFNRDCLAAITQAVQRCEQSTLAQVCVIAEQTLPFSYLRKNLPVRERAITLFGKHRVWDTEHNTGVLIYVNMVERCVELIADRVVTRFVAQPQWDAWVAQLNTDFANNRFQEGLVAVIDAMHPVFAQALPASAGASSNALGDAPIVL